MRLRPVFLAGTLACVACTRTLQLDRPTTVTVEPEGGNLPRPKVLVYGDFWAAIRDVNFEVARDMAATDDRRSLAAALDAFLVSPADDSEKRFAALIRSASDSLVRRAAELGVVASLQYRSAWRELRAIRPLLSPETVDQAGATAWAHRFDGAPTEELRFPDADVVLPIEISPSGVPIVAVTVNGRTFRFWIDTGSSITLLASDVATAVGAAPRGDEPLEIVTSTGRMQALPTIISQLGIGTLALESTPAMIAPPGALSIRAFGRGRLPDNVHIDGIIGYNVIRRLDLEIDYGRSRITVRDPARRARPEPALRNLLWFGIPLVRLATNEGIIVHLSLDTGADQTYATRQLITKTGLRPRAAESRVVGGFGSTITARGYVLPRLTLFAAGTALRLERVFVLAAEYPTIFSPDGTLGADVFRAGVVRIDATSGVFSVSPAR